MTEWIYGRASRNLSKIGVVAPEVAKIFLMFKSSINWNNFRMISYHGVFEIAVS
jgi:hypothetical protein